jgi:hypothetical protein
MKILNETIKKTIKNYLKTKKLLNLFLVLNDGYCINIKHDPAIGTKTNKNVNSKDYLHID